MDEEGNITTISLIADYDGNVEDIFNVGMDSDIVPLLPLRNMVLFPGAVLPVSIERKFSLEVVKKAVVDNSYIGVTYQLNPNTDTPKRKDLYDIGTIGKVMRVIELPNGNYTALIQGFCRFGIRTMEKRGNIYKASTYPIYEENCNSDDKEYGIVIDSIREQTAKLMQVNNFFGDDNSFAVKNIHNATFLVNYVCTNISISVKEKIELLKTTNPKSRAMQLLSLLNREIEFASLKADIQKKTREDLDQQQREYFLRQQISNIQEELGATEASDIKELREKLTTLTLPSPTRETLTREIDKLEHINPQSPDYQVLLNYLQTVLSMPWGKYSEDNIDIHKAELTLNRDHYGIIKVKERILEHLAVIKKRGDFKSPIICLYGPPGIGKTSLGRSIATAMGRKPGSRLLSFEIIRPSADIRRLMELRDESVEVYRFTRIRNVNDEPLILETSFYPCALYPNLTREQLETDSFYSLLYQVGVVPANAVDSYEAVLFGRAEGELLHCKPGSCGFSVQRRTFDVSGMCYEFTQSLIRADRVKLDVYLHKDGVSFSRSVDRGDD